MRKSFAIAGLTLRLQWRSGMLAGGVLLVGIVSALIFFAVSGDGDAISELKVRIQYAHAIAYSLLTLFVVAVAVFAVRSQIDGRQFHMLDSEPVSRTWILIGQWIGVSLSALIMQGALLLTLLGCSTYFLRNAPEDQQVQAKAHYQTSRAQILPTMPVLEDEAKRRLDLLIRDGQTDPDTVNEELWSNLVTIVRREQQLVSAGATRTWNFNLRRFAGSGEDVKLHYRFVADFGDELIKGMWTIEGDGSSPPLQLPFSVNAYVESELLIPAVHIPDSGKLRVTLSSGVARDLIVNRETGLRIFVASGSLWSNLSSAFSVQAFHLSVATAVGLAAGVAFTFSVAAFVSMVLCIVAACAGFFRGVARELAGFGSGALNDMAVYLLSGGTWLAEGLRPPPIAVLLGQGIEIPMANLMTDWGASVLLYGILTLVVGCVLISIKELDKLQT